MKIQINSLTATRVFAAIMVYIFHFGRDVFPFSLFRSLFNSANIAVSYFYVLSGFVLYISYVESKFTYGNFIKKRLGRIAPAYVLALILYMVVYFFYYKMEYSAEVGRQILYSLFFIQAYFPAYALVLNTAAWSISVEMFFYLLFPVLLLVQKRNSRVFIAAAVLIYLLTQIIFSLCFQGADHVESFNFLVYNPVMHVNEFLIGMVGGYLFKRIKRTGKKYWLAPVAIFFVMLLLLALRPLNFYYDVGLIAPVFMAFILATAYYNPAFLNVKALVILGEISYGIYIFQFPVHELVQWLNVYMKLPFPVFFYFSLLALCLVATLSYYFVERPVRDKINAITFRKRTITRL